MAGLGVKRVVADTSGLVTVSATAKRRAIALKAVKAGAKLVQAAARAKAPRRKVDGGGLQQSIGIKPVKGTRGKTLAFCVVGPRVKVERQVRQGRKTYKYVPAKTAHIVEGGARPHEVRRGKGGGVVRHPGARKQPWLAPAWEEQKGRAAEATAAVLLAETERAAARAAVRKGR